MKIIVTGGAGFIGSHLVELLLNKKGYRVLVIDDLSHGNSANLSPKTQLIKMDIRNRSLGDVFKAFKPDVVFHLAALVNVHQSLLKPLQDVSINVSGSLNVFQAAKAVGARQLIFASSVAVYGDNNTLPLKERVKCQPISVYGISKLCAEYYLNTFKDNYLTTTLRFANVYGPRQDSGAEGGVVAIFMNNLVEGKDNLIFGDGKQTRDFIYVKDIANGLYAAAQTGESGTFNLSTNLATSISNLYDLCQGLAKSDKKAKITLVRQGDIANSVLDNRSAQKSLNWKPEYTLFQGLKETYQYFSLPIAKRRIKPR